MSVASETKSSPWGALLRVMTEPTATFQALAERPAILPAYLVQMVSGLIGAAVVLPLTLAAIADQLSAAPNTSAGVAQFARVTGIASAIVGAVLSPWVVGAIVALIASFFAQFQGGSIGFRRYFSMVGYARIPLAIGALLQSALTTRAATIQEAQSLGLNLATLAPQDASPALKAFLTSINPFDLFYYALLAIGFGVLQRTKPARSAALVGTIYVLVVALTFAGLALSKSRGL